MTNDRTELINDIIKSVLGMSMKSLQEIHDLAVYYYCHDDADAAHEASNRIREQYEAGIISDAFLCEEEMGIDCVESDHMMAAALFNLLGEKVPAAQKKDVFLKQLKSGVYDPISSKLLLALSDVLDFDLEEFVK